MPICQPIIARSQAFTDIMVMAERVASANCPILITGESGTGKELVARTIHDNSSSRNGRYLPVNVAAIPSELMESQLFGHVRGAFTGADHDRLGAFRSADGGTLLLDEIGDLPLFTQPKLLRAIELQEVQPVGSDTTHNVNVRFIAATSCDLDRLVEQKRFRADLLFRLNVVQISIPPLRERPEDIPVLSEYYCEHFCRIHNKPAMRIGKAAMQALINYDWSGNVRELAHTLERAVLLCDSRLISPSDLPDTVNSQAYDDTASLHDAVESFKRRHIVKTLEAVDGDRQQAAKQLGLSSATLFRYIDRYNLKGYAINRCT